MARMVSLAQLVEEGLGTSPAELLLDAVNAGWAWGLDARGQAGLHQREADRLRQERAEAEARAARDAELARQQAQDDEVAALVAAEKQARLREREQRLVDRTGLTLWQLDREMRRAAYLAPGTGGSLEDRDRIANRQYTIDDYERFVVDVYGPDVLGVSA